MGRRTQTRKLHVLMNGELAGDWTISATGNHAFAYHPDWPASEFARPISISMPLRPSDSPYRGPEVESFFDNLLPDNPDIRRRFQSRFGARSPQAFDLLSEIGRDCVGALRLLPEDQEPEPIRSVQTDPLGEAGIADILRGAASASLFRTADSEAFRISIAGAQEKTALLKVKGKWHRPKGATPTSHIFKLPMGGSVGREKIDMSASVENEWLCARIVEAFGIPAAACEMASFEDQRALVVKRFDRQWSKDKSWLIRLPQEDMCQALAAPMGRKYESDGAPGMGEILGFLLGSRLRESDRRTFLKTQVLFWMLGAVDGHARNFSIFIGRGGAFNLTPLYDILSAYPVMGHGRNRLPPGKAKMAMAVRGGGKKQYAWDRIMRRHWLETARVCGMESEIKGILAELIESAGSAVDEVAAALPPGFPAQVAEPILAGLGKAARRLDQAG